MDAQRHSTPPLVARLAEGAVAGAAATALMTVVMEAGFRLLPPQEQYPLPPRLIVEEAAARMQAPLPGDEGDRVGLTLLAHFGYGTAGGAVLGLMLPRSAGRAVLAGAAFGLAVWAASYLGWLPAVGLLRPATRMPAGRNAVMIGGHLVWGGSSGLIAQRLCARRSSSNAVTR